MKICIQKPKSRAEVVREISHGRTWTQWAWRQPTAVLAKSKKKNRKEMQTDIEKRENP